MKKKKEYDISPEDIMDPTVFKQNKSKPNRVLSTISILVLCVAFASLFIIAGAIVGCHESEGTFLPNFRCINKTALDYCLMPDEKIGYSPGGPRIDKDRGFVSQ